MIIQTSILIIFDIKMNYLNFEVMAHLWKLGYSAEDIVTNIFRVCKTHAMAEYLKLEFIKEIGRTHLLLVQGTSSLVQLTGKEPPKLIVF